MPISRSGTMKIKVARTYRGKCGICLNPVFPGQAYMDCVGGTNSSSGYLAHYNCYKPEGAPPIQDKFYHIA